MSKFNKYAVRLNEIAKAAFSEYKVAENKYQNAKEKYEHEANPYVQHSTHSKLEQDAAIARAKADMLAAQQALKNAQENMQKQVDSVQNLRRELETAVDEEYCANGEQVDIATLELLKSGVLKSKEYITLFNRAQQNNNYTMQRIIGKYMGDAAEKAPTNELQVQMRTLANSSQVKMGSDEMGVFDALTDVFSRCSRNPLLIDRWDGLTAEAIEEF